MVDEKLVAIIPGKHIRKVLHDQTLSRFNGKDPFRVAKEPLWPDMVSVAGFVTAKYSPLQKELQDVIDRLKAGGIIEQMMIRYYSPRAPKGDYEEDEVELEALGLAHIALGLCVYLPFIFFSLLIFAIEKVA